MHRVQFISAMVIALLLALPVLPPQDPKPNEPPIEKSQIEFTEAEKVWWKEFEPTENALVKLENDKRRELAEIKTQVEQSYRERRDTRLDKMEKEVFDKQQPVIKKFAPLIEKAVANYLNALVAGAEQDVRVPLDDKKMPTVLHQEKAKYTEEARQNRVQGVVTLSVVFQPDGKITNIRVVKGLADGLVEKAIEVVTKQVFRPAVKQNRFIAVRGSLEFSFNLF